MALEGIVKKIGNSVREVVAVGLAALAASGAGSVPVCAQQNAKYAPNVVYVHCTQQKKTENWGQLLSVLGILGGFQNHPNVQKLGTLASTVGQMELQKEVAREGRDQITVNQGGAQPAYVPAPGCAWVNPGNPNDFSVRQSIGLAFAANDWIDLNYDRRPDLNEYVGVKNRFHDDEEIIVVIHNQSSEAFDRPGKSLRVEIYDPNGKRVLEKKLGGWGVEFIPGASRHFKVDWAKKNGGFGTYTIVWRSKGITEMTRFEIVPTP